MGVGWIVFGLRGRINRAKYWLAILGLLPFSFFTLLLAVGATGLTIEDMKAGTLEAQRRFSLAQLIQLAVIGWPMAAVSAKRFQDRNRPPWIALIGLAIFALPNVVGALGLGGTPSAPTLLAGAASIIALAVGVWWFLELGCLKGTTGSNQYGGDPLVPPTMA